jgi:exodeoxyribonuclease VII small subunit
MENAEPMTFEAALVRLEEIVAELDQGDLALEQALALFEEGSKLKALCETRLAEAEATVEQLLQPPAEAEGGGETTEDSPGSLFGDDL